MFPAKETFLTDEEVEDLREKQADGVEVEVEDEKEGEELKGVAGVL